MCPDFVYYTESNDILQRSTSLDWIWTYLKQHYNIESHGVHFLKISSIVPENDEHPQTYYRRLGAAFLDNLRKKGDVLKREDNKR